MLNLQLEEKIDKAVRKIFIEEMDSRVKNLPSKSDFAALKKEIDQNSIDYRSSKSK